MQPNPLLIVSTAFAGKSSKGGELAQVDHATMYYPDFRRRFYLEVPVIQRMTEEEANLARKTEGVEVSQRQHTQLGAHHSMYYL